MRLEGVEVAIDRWTAARAAPPSSRRPRRRSRPGVAWPSAAHRVDDPRRCGVSRMPRARSVVASAAPATVTRHGIPDVLSPSQSVEGRSGGQETPELCSIGWHRPRPCPAPRTAASRPGRTSGAGVVLLGGGLRSTPSVVRVDPGASRPAVVELEDPAAVHEHQLELRPPARRARIPSSVGAARTFSPLPVQQPGVAVPLQEGRPS